MIPPPNTPLEQEIDANWQEYPAGVGVFLIACENGTIKGTFPVYYTDPDCGCAYGHISGLDEKHAWDIIYKRRAEFTYEGEYTPLENKVYSLQPGDTLNNPIVRELYDLILARKPEEKGQS
jgi:hypothetical protein